MTTGEDGRRGQERDELVVAPSPLGVEPAHEPSLESDPTTRADMAATLERLRAEVATRRAIEEELRSAQGGLESRVEARTRELERVVEELRRSDQRFRDVIEALPLGVHRYRLCPGDRLVFEGANPAADVILGVDNQRFVGQVLEAAFPPLAQTEVPARYREVCRSGQPWRRERLAFHDDPIDGCFDIQAFRTGEDTLAVVFRDVTAEVRAERERDALRDSLGRSRRMEALAILAGGVAHDLNNILTGLTAYPELILMDLPASSPHRPLVETILEAGSRAAAVVADLLTVARGVAVVHQPVDLAVLVSELIESVDLRAVRQQHSEVSIQLDLDRELPLVSGSPVHLRRAVMNLLTNGIEAVSGAGRVVVSMRARSVASQAVETPEILPGEYVALVVEDSGGGIAAADLERIFEPFYSRKVLGHSGTGLGLAIVWTTVRDHGGFLDVTSRPGETRVSMFLPALARQAAAAARSPYPDLAQGHGETVLVVDDESILREAARLMLARLGYRAHTVDSGRAALELLRTVPIDAVLLDMVMPGGLGGRETYEQIVALRPGLPTILVSGHAENDAVRAAQALGAGPLLRKPFRIAQLAAMLRDALARRP